MPKPLLSSPLHPLSVSSRTVHIPGAHTCTQAHKISHTPPTLSETVKTGAHTPPFHGVPIQAAAALPKLLVLLSCHTLGAAAPGPTRLIWTQVGGVTANIREQCCCSCCKSAQETASAAVEYILFSSACENGYSGVKKPQTCSEGFCLNWFIWMQLWLSCTVLLQFKIFNSKSKWGFPPVLLVS